MRNNDIELFKLADDFQKRMGIRTFRASLGDINGRVDEPGQDGFVRVRIFTASGLSDYITVRNLAQVNKIPGNAVIVGYDPDSGNLAVLRLDFTGQIAQGTNPTSSNIADPNNSYWISQQRLVTLASHPVSSAANSMLVTVEPWFGVDLSTDTTSYFEGQQIDLTSYIPSGAGEWCLACLFLKTDMTIEVVASTPKDSPADLGFDDINECLAARTAGSLPVWAWQLYNGQTGIASGAPATGGDDFMDLRQIINSALGSGGGGSGTVTSVALTAAPSSVFGVSGSPVTTAGTLALTLDDQAANKVLAGPTTGADAEPAFRALVDADIPSALAGHVITGGSINNTPIGATTPNTLIASALSLLIGGFKAIFTHANSADRTYTLPNYNGTLATLDGVETFTNKTLTTPTIADFSNANHNHTNSAGGGQITDAALSAAVGIAKGGTGQTTKTAAMDALSPTSAKGDLLVDDGTNVIALAVGVTNGHVLTVDSGQASGLKYAAVPTVISEYAVIEEEVTSGQAGGTSAATTWTTRNLNNEITDPANIVSISSNQFTLPPGTYRIFVNSPFLGNATTTGAGRLRLRNMTNSATIQVSANHGILLNQSVNMTMEAYFVNAGTTAYAIQYYLTVGRTTNGLGLAVSEAGVNEKYTQVSIEKLS